MKHTDDWYAAKVRKTSEGRWELVGGYDSMERPVTIRETATGRTKTDFANRILKTIAPKRTRKDREADKIAIDARIRELSDSVMCLRDFHDITDTRYVSNYINRLRSNGILKPLTMRFFCKTEAEFSALEVADSKYVMHHGRRFGLHIGNTFLRDLGFDVEDHEPCIVTSRTYEQQWTRTETIMNRNFMIMFSPVPITDNNWKVLTLLLFYDRMNECRIAVSDGSITEALRHWADTNGLVADDFRPYRSLFPDAVMHSIVGIVKRIS
jgi:hypothetical protein